MLLYRFTTNPGLIKKTILAFPKSSFLGAIPIVGLLNLFIEPIADNIKSMNILVLGIISFYNYRNSAQWAAYVLWLLAMAISLVVTFGLLTLQTTEEEPHGMEDLAGV